MFHIFFIVLSILNRVSADTYSVKVGTENHVNSIDSKFLSFTIDPKYLFSNTEKYRSKECICMASSLAPAFIRIAGPSTALLSFHNASITIDEDLEPDVQKVRFQDDFSDKLAKEFKRRPTNALESRFKRNHDRIEVSHKDWRKFVQWAKATGFDLVFALNNEEKMSSGMWDPNTALNILTVAEKANIGDIHWQLGYECKNQSIEEYLNDLETLRVITETFAPGRLGKWKVVGGDVTNCLEADSKSDFKDYVMLSDDMMDAILLNGNSSTQELERMSERDRYKLLKLLSQSSTPLWLTEAPWSDSLDQLARAVDWLTGLGHAARNGFSHHFRELGDEMFQPTLSFYMALLFKNLVGSKVLNVDMEPDQAVMFAHCTSLRHEPVPGAVTLYGVNLDDETARFSVKLAKMEEGGDILQFVLGQDASGNILVNGRPMYFEGDLKPIVKRVRPYKTLLLNLPAKSFGFWVLANTKVEACYDKNDKNNIYESIETISEENYEVVRPKIKRSLTNNDFDEYASDISVNFIDKDESINEITDKNILSKMNELNDDLNKVQNLFRDKSEGSKRIKRQTIEEKLSETRRKLKRYSMNLRNNLNKKYFEESEQKPKGILSLLRLTRRNLTRNNNKNGIRRDTRFSKNKVSKRNSKSRIQEFRHGVKQMKRTTTESPLEITDIETKARTRRSVKENIIKPKPDNSLENEIDDGAADKVKLWKILKNIHKHLKDLSEENEEYEEEVDSFGSEYDDHEHVTEKESGLIKRTVGNLMRVLSDLNSNLNRFWNAITLLN